MIFFSEASKSEGGVGRNHVVIHSLTVAVRRDTGTTTASVEIARNDATVDVMTVNLPSSSSSSSWYGETLLGHDADEDTNEETRTPFPSIAVPTRVE